MTTCMRSETAEKSRRVPTVSPRFARRRPRTIGASVRPSLPPPPPSACSCLRLVFVADVEASSHVLLEKLVEGLGKKATILPISMLGAVPSHASTSKLFEVCINDVSDVLQKLKIYD